jgi:hypothetical protein
MRKQKQHLSGTRPLSICGVADTEGCLRNVDLDQSFEVGVRDDFRGRFKARASVLGRARAGIRHLDRKSVV